MLLLTATTRTQGDQADDYFNAVDGELVAVFTDCHIPAHRDGLYRCREGCPVRFFGTNSHQAATTAMVQQIPLSAAGYLDALATYFQDEGSPAPRSAASHVAERMLHQVVTLLPGTVVGFAGGKMAVRAAPRATWAGVTAAAVHLAALPARSRYYTRQLKAARAYEA